MNAKVLVGVLCGALCQATYAATETTLYPHVPLLLWSQRSTFESKNAYLSSVLGEKEIASTLLSENQGEDKSEVLCVFLRNKLRTNEIAEFAKDKTTGSFLQHAVAGAGSSVVISHTTRTYSLLHVLRDASALKNEIAVEDLESFLSANKPLLSDKKTDLLVVHIADSYTLPEADELIKAATELLSTATAGSVDFALTGNEAEPKRIASPLGRRLTANANANSTAASAIVCETGFQIGYSSTGKAFCFSHYVHMTPEVLTGVLFGLFFIFLAYIGLSALSAIQTPTRYPHHGPPRGKEF
uniref:V-type proton ATPase subunit S1/VOA1 transmembrane domain-containing protein n=1 Tax=Globisporangium ultimum (strain ATCC 200006 / CBS 805.95 / DAOM BR144) TaxID=431595 RepID=K3WAS8_GLOUD